ncbi:MAG: DUF4783 domain-containing protein [Flavobacteriales bacterium]|nr:DUF4783 domain-containing protein [Flavobacteriales bacterium]
MTRHLNLIAAVLFSTGLLAQDAVKDQVVAALSTGNSKDLAAHFIANIDLTVKETTGVYSKAQAGADPSQVLQRQPPVGHAIEHSGVSKSGDKYFIGILHTHGPFRTTFFLKKTDTSFQVKQLRIEDSKNDF